MADTNITKLLILLFQLQLLENSFKNKNCFTFTKIISLHNYHLLEFSKLPRSNGFTSNLATSNQFILELYLSSCE